MTGHENGLGPRFDRLREETDVVRPAGLGDVYRRRARRQRNRVAGAAAGVLAAVAVTAVVVLPRSGGTPNPAATSAPTVSAETGTGGAETSPAPPTSAESPTGPSTPSAPTSPSTTTGAAPPTHSLGPQSLLTEADVSGLGLALSGPATGDEDGQPTLTPSCPSTTDWQTSYSTPRNFVSTSFPTEGGGALTQDLFEYADTDQASAALAALSTQIVDCPVINEYASIRLVGGGLSAGSLEVAMDVESGETGERSTIMITITRVDNILVEIAVRPPPAADPAVMQAIGTAAVEKVQAS